MALKIPTLRGKQVMVRKLTTADAHAIYSNVSTWAIARYMFTAYPYTLEHAHRFVRRSRLGIRRGTEYHFGVELKATPGIVGVVGLFALDRHSQNAELGCWIAKEFWGTGLSDEAVNVMLRFAFRHLKLRRVYAYTYVNNRPPQRLLRRLGFTREGLLRKYRFRRGRYRDYYVWGMVREDFHPKR
jgi:ribosomal-protein-alanine N-acetyltransferase